MLHIRRSHQRTIAQRHYQIWVWSWQRQILSYGGSVNVLYTQIFVEWQWNLWKMGYFVSNSMISKTFITHGSILRHDIFGLIFTCTYIVCICSDREFQGWLWWHHMQVVLFSNSACSLDSQWYWWQAVTTTSYVSDDWTVQLSSDWTWQLMTTQPGFCFIIISFYTCKTG